MSNSVISLTIGLPEVAVRLLKRLMVSMTFCFEETEPASSIGKLTVLWNWFPTQSIGTPRAIAPFTQL